MAVTLTGTGGLFTRLGKIGKLFNAINAFRGSTVETDVAAIAAQYIANPEIIPNLESDFLNSQSNYGSYLQTLQAYATNTVVDQVNDDNPLPNTQLSTALNELAIQMAAGSASISANTISSGVTANSGNDGNGSLVVSVANPTGVPLSWVFNEDVIVSCVNDSFTGGATAGFEQFVLQGEYALSDPLNFAYPLGSACNVGTNAVSPTKDNSSGNLLTDGDFESTWTSNVPANWALFAGTAGTDFIQETAHTYTGANAAGFYATGTTTELVQVFGNSTTGTAGVLQPLTQYAVSFWARANSSSLAGTFAVRLYDVTNSAVMQDANGNNNTSSVTVSGLTTSFVQHTAIFRTPRVLPASYRLSFLANLTSATNHLIIDHVTLTPMKQLYSGGPFVAIFSGSSPFVEGDGFVIDVVNNYGSAWGQFLQIIFNLNSLGIVIPTSGSPTIADSLLS